MPQYAYMYLYLRHLTSSKKKKKKKKNVFHINILHGKFQNVYITLNFIIITFYINYINFI